MDQINLFNFNAIEEKENTRETKDEQAITDAGDWCLVYLVTRSGGNAGNLFVLHQEDAIKLCSDECSHGRARTGYWMFQWTSLNHFIDSGDASAADRQARNVHGKLEPFVFIPDTGKQDKDFKRLGIHKPDISEIETVLNDIGYKLEYKGKKSTLQRIRDRESCITEEEYKQTEQEIKDMIKNKKTGTAK